MDDSIDFINRVNGAALPILIDATLKRAVKTLIKTAALAGIIGPSLFAIVLTILTIFEYEFIRGLGWSPFGLVTNIWPSCLALGQYGYIMSGAFLLQGVLVVLFAAGLAKALPRTTASRIATILLMLAGVAMTGLTFLTDGRGGSALTWHGRIHDGCFAALGSTLFPAMLLLGWVFRKLPSWNRLSTYTWMSAVLAVPAFAIKGAAFYVFLAAVLTWTVIVACKLGECSPLQEARRVALRQALR